VVIINAGLSIERLAIQPALIWWLLRLRKWSR